MLSGGPDSTVLLHYLIRELGRTPLALHFAGLSSYGETDAARAVARSAGVDLHIIDMDSFLDACRTLRVDEGGEGQRAIFAATAIYFATLAVAVAHRIPAMALGLHQQDAEAYVEQSAQYLEYIAEGLRLVGTACQLLVPFHTWSKVQVLQKGKQLGVDFGMTWSCLRSITGIQDGTCTACRSRQATFQALGIEDPTKYANGL
jgi:7-cyano-7-deazaguanine synthase